MQLTGQVDADQYMSFGISGTQDRSQMLNSDVVVAYTVNANQAFVVDYNITSLAPVSRIFFSDLISHLI